MFPARSSDRDSRTNLAWLFFIAVMVAYAVIVITARWPPPSVDYPEWVYQGVIFRHWLTGHPDPGYFPKHYPVPFSSTTVVVGLLNLVMSWQLAGDLWICAYFALAGVSCWMLTRALRVTSPLLVIALPSMIFLNLEFWWGRIGFETGLCFLLMLIALVLRGARQWVLAIVLLAIYFSHMLTTAGAFLFLGLWVLQTRQWRKLWFTAPTLVLCAWYVAARVLGGNADSESVPESTWLFGSKAFFLFKSNTYFKMLGFVNARTPQGLSQSEEIFGRVLFVVLLAVAVCLTVVAFATILRSAVKRLRSDRKDMAIFTLVMIPSSFLIPQIFLGSTDPGTRLALMGVAVGLFLVRWDGWTGRVIATLSVVLCLANLYQFALLDHSPYRPAHARDLPTAMLTLGHTQPSGTLIYYDHLDRGQMDMGISTTSVFLMQKP